MMNSLQAELKGLRVCDDALAAIQQAYALLEQPIEKSSASYQEVRNRVEAITRSLIQSTVSGLLQGAKNNDLEKVGTATMSVGENSLALVQNVKLVSGYLLLVRLLGDAVCVCFVAVVDTCRPPPLRPTRPCRRSSLPLRRPSRIILRTSLRTPRHTASVFFFFFY